MPELRTGKRFPLQLPITISEEQSARKHQGTTTNVSAAGVYVRAERPLKVGSKITFDIMLPGQVLGTGHDVQICCAGRVVRAESSRRVPRTKQAAVREKLRGMACVIDQYRFIRNSTE
ncbi:MAG TPA: PilZ domain-containing protein [Terriglobales bacterium]|nr:PilZ domain-containing protein [Terriglobales bacterium]